MRIHLTWREVAKLIATHRIERQGVTITTAHPIQDALTVEVQGNRVMVSFVVEERLRLVQT